MQFALGLGINAGQIARFLLAIGSTREAHIFVTSCTTVSCTLGSEGGTSHALSYIMFAKKCPHCGVKLGAFLYADVCPHCHEVLKHNLPLLNSVHLKVATAKSWPVRAFLSIQHFVES